MDKHVLKFRLLAAWLSVKQLSVVRKSSGENNLFTDHLSGKNARERSRNCQLEKENPFAASLTLHRDAFRLSYWLYYIRPTLMSGQKS